MKMPLENLKSLRDDMKAKGWHIASFLFTYKDCHYIILVRCYTVEEKRPDLALVKLEFLREEDIDDALAVPANSQRLLIDAKTLREYFHIEYAENLGDILLQFSERLGAAIPEKVKENPSGPEKAAMVHALDISDAEDPNRIYCFKVKRNPLEKNGKLSQRSIYNDNKTRLLRKKLYEKLSKDTNISFCYSPNELDEKTDEEILRNWAANQHENRQGGNRICPRLFMYSPNLRCRSCIRSG
jgi:hypothetical protein